jgi:hypothetical protein
MRLFSATEPLVPSIGGISSVMVDLDEGFFAGKFVTQPARRSS